MNKHIDSEAFFKVINTLPYKDTSYPDASAYNGAISDVADMLTHFPAADVAEVRHGKWEWNESIKTEDMDGWFIDEQGYVCSECGFIGVDNFNYCPNCGAKMDGDTE